MKILQIKQWSLSGQIQIDLFFEDVLDFEMSPQVYQVNYPVGQVLLWYYYQLHH